jgi:O-antigen/teichoic acid export membrane protein
MPLAFGFAALMEIPLRIFGPEYVSGMTPAVIVTIASALTSVSAVYASVLLALSKLRWYIASNMIGLAGLLAVSALLTPIVGLNAPALGRASLMIIATCIYALATLRSGVFEIDLKAYLISAISSAFMSMLVFGGFSLVHSFYIKVAVLPAFIVGGGLIYLGLLRAFRLLSNDDIDFIREIVPQVFHKFLPKIAKLAGLNYEVTPRTAPLQSRQRPTNG